MVENADMDNSNLVSIIMPAYRCQDTLLKAVISVVDQTYQDWELIIINDCCPVNSYKVISDIQDQRVSILHNEINSGVAITRNKGIEMAKGQYIAFLDSDDYWLPEKLSLQIPLLKNDADIVYSAYYREINNVRYLVSVKKDICFSDMLKKNHIGNLTGIYNVGKLGKVFQKNIGHEDYLMWLNLCNESINIVGVNSPLAVYTVNNNAISSNKYRAATWQWFIYRKELKFSFITSLYYFIFYIFNAIKKNQFSRRI